MKHNLLAAISLSIPALSFASADMQREDFGNWISLMHAPVDMGGEIGKARRASAIGFDNNSNQFITYECSKRDDGFEREAFRIKVPNTQNNFEVDYFTNETIGKFFMADPQADNYRWSTIDNLSFIRQVMDSQAARIEFTAWERKFNSPKNMGVTKVIIDTSNMSQAVERSRAYCNGTKFHKVTFKNGEIYVDGKQVNRFCYEPLAGDMSGDSFTNRVFITRPEKYLRGCNDSNYSPKWFEHEIKHLSGNYFAISVIDGRNVITYNAKINNVRVGGNDAVVMERISYDD
ncbi:hypothetical protein [Vibrio mediterranei]|uniref:hypothetical protein n=1 Tax=Vibrio mediterranei TaxID=689 RepID=UPI001EFEACB6|nr:hypothetical protein [Vibrio mediterranei]MCG9660600.1 hypothetical protein [Vibrio mediterranei]